MRRAVLVAEACFIFIISGGASGAEGDRLGGPCTYAAFKGKCRVISIKKTADSINQKKSAGYEGYEIKFKFTLLEGVVLPAEKKKIFDSFSHNQDVFSLELSNTWYPGIKSIEKYKIKEGETFDCALEVIDAGTCTPVVFEFQTIDRADYCDTQK